MTIDVVEGAWSTGENDLKFFGAVGVVGGNEKHVKLGYRSIESCAHCCFHSGKRIKKSCKRYLEKIGHGGKCFGASLKE